jgi:hypothetical protein
MSEILAQLLEFVPGDLVAMALNSELLSMLPDMFGSVINFVISMFEVHWALGSAILLLAISGFVFILQLAAAAALAYYAFTA